MVFFAFYWRCFTELLTKHPISTGIFLLLKSSNLRNFQYGGRSTVFQMRPGPFTQKTRRMFDCRNDSENWSKTKFEPHFLSGNMINRLKFTLFYSFTHSSFLTYTLWTNFIFTRKSRKSDTLDILVWWGQYKNVTGIKVSQFLTVILMIYFVFGNNVSERVNHPL